MQKTLALCALLLAAACGGTGKPHEGTLDSGSGSILPGALGAACAGRADCNDGLGCLTEAAGFPGGHCSKSCASASCPTEGACVDLSVTTAAAVACARTCQIDADCRKDYVCCARFGACLPQPMCAAGAPPPDAGHPDGGSDGGHDGGADGGTDGGTSDGGSDGGTSDGGTTDGGVTFKTCTPPGNPRLVAGGTVGPTAKPASCQKPVAQSSLPAGQVVKLGTHTVGDQLTFDVPASTQSVSIVSQAVNATETITYQGSPLENSVVPTLVTRPDGTVLWDEKTDVSVDPSAAPTYPIWYVGLSPNTGVMTFPATTAAFSSMSSGVPAGKWKATVNDYALECLTTANCTGGNSNNTYDMSVLLKPGPLQSSGTVDIAFYLVTTRMTAAQAVNDASVKRMVQTLSTIYGRAGVCLGDVTFYDVPQWARTEYATGIDADKTGPCDGLDQMFTLSKPGNALNFFLVESITSNSAGGQVVGIDGTIPGPSTLGGTVKSGAAVSMADLKAGSCGGSISLGSCGADVVAYIAAHEGGHWLGLFHATEAVGTWFDPYGDTNMCKCSSCVGTTRARNCLDKNASASSPTLVNATDCNKGTATCGGADNLMFWLIDGNVSVGNFSADQGRTVRANLVVQ